MKREAVITLYVSIVLFMKTIRENETIQVSFSTTYLCVTT